MLFLTRRVGKKPRTASDILFTLLKFTCNGRPNMRPQTVLEEVFTRSASRQIAFNQL